MLESWFSGLLFRPFWARGLHISALSSSQPRLFSPFSFSVNNVSVTFELHYLKQVTETF